MKKDLYKINMRDIPLIPLRGVSVFPYMVIHFDVGREKSINALEKAMVDDSLIFLCSQIDAKIDDPNIDEFHHVGTICKIKQMLKLPGGSIRVLIEGINRGRILNIKQEEPYFEAEIEEFTYEADNIKIDNNTEAAMRLVADDFEEYVTLSNRVSPELLLTISEIKDPGRLVDMIASYVYLKPEDNQKILEVFDIYDRLETIHGILQEEIDILKIEEKINQRVKGQISKVQKEYYLKEQMKAIQEELGERDEIAEEVDKYKKKINDIKMPKEVKEKTWAMA